MKNKKIIEKEKKNYRKTMQKECIRKECSYIYGNCDKTLYSNY